MGAAGRGQILPEAPAVKPVTTAGGCSSPPLDGDRGLLNGPSPVASPRKAAFGSGGPDRRVRLLDFGDHSIGAVDDARIVAVDLAELHNLLLIPESPVPGLQAHGHDHEWTEAIVSFP